MDKQVFDKLLDYLEYDPTDLRAITLESIFVHGFTRAEASRAFGMSTGNLTLLVERVVRKLQKVKNLTGVDLEPKIRRGVPGRRTVVNQ